MNRGTIQKALLRLLIAAIILSSAALSVCAAGGDTLFSADYELYKGDTGESGTGAEAGRLTVSSKAPVLDELNRRILLSYIKDPVCRQAQSGQWELAFALKP